MILDNADDLSLIQPFIQGLQSGHILLTTRAQATGTISKVEIQKLPDQEGVVFLLRRAKLITKDISYEHIPQELRTQTLAIVKELDGLPLAIDQAGAYIEETQCGLAGYLDLYRTHGVDLLKERGLFGPWASRSSGHDLGPVFSKNRAEPIPPPPSSYGSVHFFTPMPYRKNSSPRERRNSVRFWDRWLRYPISFNKTIGEILKFSLIHRDMNTNTLDIHRLVQSVIQNSLDHEIRNQWIERLVQAINRVFPDAKFENWPKCERFLPHALNCATLLSLKI